MDETRLAKGNYLSTKDALGSEAPIDNKASTFHISNEVAIIGGFQGYEAIIRKDDISQRNMILNTTVLSGDMSADNEEIFLNYSYNSNLILHQNIGLPSLRLGGLTVSR